MKTGQPSSTAGLGSGSNFSFQVMWESHKDGEVCVGALTLTSLRIPSSCAE